MEALTPSTPEPTDGITENFSENPLARQRGRPRVFRAGAYPISREQFPTVQTERGQLNARYAMNALVVLLKEDHPDRERYGWLCPKGAFLYLSHLGAAMPGLRPKLKTTILSELGRVYGAYGEAAMRQVALQLCEDKPKTQEAVQRLRAWRLDQEPREGQPLDLYDAIVRTIGDYLARYPATPLDVIGLVLWQLHRTWEEAPDGPPADEDAAPDQEAISTAQDA